jgi:uncharacterized protein (DUF1330 family)
MSAYLIVDAKSSDPDRMGEYRRLAELAIGKFGGRYLVRGGAYQVLEGDWHPQRLVVVQFDSTEQARSFYDSPEYLAARKARADCSRFDMLLIEGH